MRSVIRNLNYFFHNGLTWPRRTNSALAARVLPTGCVFADMGPALFADDVILHLGWLNTRTVRLLIDATAASADEDKTDVSRNYWVGIIQSLPSPLPLGVEPGVSKLTAAVVQAVAALDATDETSRRFVAPRALAGSTILEAVRAGRADRWEQAAKILNRYAYVDRAFSSAIDPRDEIEGELRDASGPLLAELPDDELGEVEADEAARLLSGTVADAVEAATAKLGVARWIGLQHHIVDRRLELAALTLNRSPVVLAAYAAKRGLFPAEELGRYAADLVSYLIGCAFGRWDVRIGRDPSLAPPMPSLFDPVPLCPPGQFVRENRLPVTDAPAGYPIRLPPGRLLVDEHGHSWDIEAAVLKAAEVLFDDSATVVGEMLQILGRKTIRDHLRKQFFKDHLTRYSKSRRKAPIYWPLTVPSRSWGVWVYAPMLTRETLYAVTSEAGRRERLAGDAITRLQYEQHEVGRTGRPARKVAEELDAEEKLAEELRRFRAEAERVAGLGWEPDLDDGIVLCAAPLADLFPSWPEAKAVRAELRKGKYKWATVATWADQL
jgi:hypothetical protein